MVGPLPQHDDTERTNSASQGSEDHYAVLTKVIDDITNDHALLRKLVYALAWQNFHPEAIIRRPIPEAQKHANSIRELAQALELKRAMDRIEAEAAHQTARQISTTPPLPATTRHDEPRPSDPGDSTRHFDLVAAVEDIPLTDQFSKPLVTAAETAFMANT